MSSQLYKDARRQFVKDAEGRYKDSKDLEMLRDFLTQNSSPEDARAAAGSLKSKASEKWGSKKVGDIEIPELWIDRIMENIENFVAIGNYAMTGAPESVGLAWFAVKLTLSAIQSNYELYSFFGSALTDISEIMIIIPHYDRLYDERSTVAKHEWKPSPVVDKLFQDIISAYAAVLNFSFAVKRHLGAGTLAKWRHGIKDFFGANKAKFEGKMSTISSCKTKILEDSQAIFQDKTLHQLDSVKGIVSNIEGTVSKIEGFQSELRKLQEVVLKNMEDIKASTKPKTPWDFALQVFEKNSEILNPLNNTSEALGKAIDWRHPGTCSWIFQNQDYMRWVSSVDNKVLCLNGQQDSGKSTVLATVVEQLDLELENTAAVIYLNCTSGHGASTAQTIKVDAICRTLLYVLYDRARQDENNLKLLEQCNRIIMDPRQEEKRARGGLKKDNKADSLTDFAEAYLELTTQLHTNVVVALDEIDSLAEEDQQELATKIKAVVTPKSSQSLKFLIGCRSASKFFNQIQPLGDKLHAVNVGDFNDDDMKKQLKDELKHISGLTVAEQKEAADVILQKAGPRFAYIGTIAVPFMRQPFQRPLSRRLEALPEGMSGVYSEALSKMAPNYVELLRVALTWTLLAPLPLRVDEIMDMYHGVYYGRGHEFEEQARNLEIPTFTVPSLLELEQIQDARGPFLKLEQDVWSGYHFVHLQDPQQVRDFCIREGYNSSHSSSSEPHLCARCKTSTSVADTLIISPKEGHLQLALHCMRTMNNPCFQRRYTSVDFCPLWSLPAILEDDLPGELDQTEPDADMKPIDSELMENNVTAGEQEAVLKEEDLVIRPKLDSGDAAVEVKIESEDATENATVKTEIEPEDATEEATVETEIGPEDVTGDANFADTTADAANDEDADDSQDDEDKGDFDFSKPGEESDENERKDPERRRTGRYEFKHWFYHIQQAEELWSPEERADSPLWAELFEELDFWVNDPLWCRRWQVTYTDLLALEGYLKPIHIAAYLGLTSWASYLLDKGADVNDAPYEISRTPLQLAAVQAKSRKMLELLLERGADPNISFDGYLPAFYTWLMNNPDLESVQLFLKYGADPTQVTGKHKLTALHCFAYSGEDAEALDLILNYSVNGKHLNIDATDSDGDTALHMLLCRQKVPIPLLKALMTRGADVNVDNHASIRPLQMACIYGEIDALKVLCENKEISQIDDLDDDGDTALLQAVAANYADCMKFLLEIGSDPNIQNKKSRTALHEAAAHGTTECVQVLLDHGANPNLLDKHNRTPLFCACLDSSNEEKATLILAKLLQVNVPLAEINTFTKWHRSPIREAAGHGFEHVLSKLIETAKARDDLASLSINERDERKGMTPLHRAAWLGKAKCVELLLGANADVTITERDDKTAMVLAYEQWARASHLTAFEDIISMLITKDPNAARIDSELVAICAVNGSVRLLTQLAAIGANLNGQDQYGWTPLDLAQKSQQKATIHYLKQQAAWAGMLPSRWGPSQWTEILEDGLTINHTVANMMCISTSKPLPAGLDKFYFEVTCRQLDGFPEDWYPRFAIGFCTIGSSAILFPGWPPRTGAPSARSWGYHGDDGGLFDSTHDDGKAAAHGLPYHGGDTVGCGVDLNAQTVWFTKNGKKLESGFQNVGGRLFPLLGLSDYVEIKTNLAGPFLWPGEDGEKVIEEEEAKQP